MYIKNDDLQYIIKTFKSFNYSKKEINKIIKNFNYYKKHLFKIQSSYEFYNAKMLEFGYSEEIIHALFLEFPKVMFCRFRNNKLRQEYLDFIDQYQTCQRAKESALVPEFHYEFDKIKQILKFYDVDDERINNAFAHKLPIIFMDPAQLGKNLSFYIENGLTKEELRTILKLNLNSVCFTADELEDFTKIIVAFGLNIESYLDIVKKMLARNFVITLKGSLEFFTWAHSKKFDYQKIGKGIKTSAILLKSNTDYLERSYNDIMDLGYTEEDTCSIISGALTILGVKGKTLKNKRDVLKEFDFTEEEIIYITVVFPAYFTMGEENLREKLKVIVHHNLVSAILDNPRNLIQGAKLTEARCNYLKLYYPNIQSTELAKDIFKKKCDFNKKYGNREDNAINEPESSNDSSVNLQYKNTP